MGTLETTSGSVNKILQNLTANNFNFTPAFDGKYHRFNRLKPKSGWYISSIVETRSGVRHPLVVCGDWVSGERFKFYDDTLTDSNNTELKAAIEKAMQEEGVKRKERADFAKTVAAEEWNLAEPDRVSPYMQKKGFTWNFGARVSKDGTLLIPTYAEDVMWGLERIYADGKKMYLPGQRMKGCYFVIGHLTASAVAYLCEGFATGCSIHMATNAAVIVAFSANNMIDVAKSFTSHKVVPAADNDRFTEGNPGITAAHKASAYLGYKPVVPTFGQDDTVSTDFNDLHNKSGIDECRKQLEVPMGNVVGIRSKEQKVGRVKMADVYRRIADAMVGKNIPPVPDFPVRFHVVEPSPGTRLIAQETEPEVLHYVSEKAVVQAILQYAHQLYLPRTQDGVGFEHKHASECMKFWRSYIDPISEPKMVSWPGEAGYTLRRMPWPLQEGETPLFDEFMERTTNAKALQCFIGSLFFDESDLQQYVWIKGLGQNGKGALSRFLRKALNGAYSAQTAPKEHNQFWTSGIIGARLVVFPDCNNRTFVASGLFKSLTGGDPVRIEMKGQQPFTTELKAKYLFMSNENPHLSSERADMRRAIYCEMEEIHGRPRPEYEAELWAEGGQFLAKCFRLYMESCPNHGQIPIGDNDSLENLVSTLEEEFEVALNSYFIIGEGKQCHPAQFQNQLDFIWKNDRRSQLEFRNWLERTHGIKKTSRRVSGTQGIKIYTGIEAIRYPEVKTSV